MIYLDNSATTKPYPSVLASFQQVAEKYFANPSSIHSLGGETERLLTKAREQISQILQVHQEEVVFTSGGTEGNNLAINGIALQHQNRGKHLITSQIEHPSVFDSCMNLVHIVFDYSYLTMN